MLSAERRKFSTRTILSVIATAHSSPIVKRLHALVGLHEFAEHLRIEAAIGVRDERPGDAEYARIALQRSVGKLGQLTIEAAREGRRGFRESALRRRENYRPATRRRV